MKCVILHRIFPSESEVDASFDRLPSSGDPNLRLSDLGALLRREAYNQAGGWGVFEHEVVFLGLPGCHVRLCLSDHECQLLTDRILSL